MGSFLTHITGTFTCVSTGSGVLHFAYGSASASTQIDGNLIIQGGTLDFSGLGTGTLLLTLYGNYNQTGGTFENITTSANMTRDL